MPVLLLLLAAGGGGFVLFRAAKKKAAGSAAAKADPLQPHGIAAPAGVPAGAYPAPLPPAIDHAFAQSWEATQLYGADDPSAHNATGFAAPAALPPQPPASSAQQFTAAPHPPISLATQQAIISGAVGAPVQSSLVVAPPTYTAATALPMNPGAPGQYVPYGTAPAPTLPGATQPSTSALGPVVAAPIPGSYPGS